MVPWRMQRPIMCKFDYGGVAIWLSFLLCFILKSAKFIYFHISRTPKLYCESEDCPVELLRPPEDCNVNSSLSFTLQVITVMR